MPEPPPESPPESPPRPPEWRLLGHPVALEFDPATGLYKACVTTLPGCHARGPDRTSALEALAAAIESYHLGPVC